MVTYMKRHELWRMNYRKSRYMENLSADELKERFEILLDNWMTIAFGDDWTPKIAPMPFAKEPHWMEIQTHVLEECALRGYPNQVPPGYSNHRGFLDKVNFEAKQEAFKRTGLEAGTFKLGMAEHLATMREKGTMRICPATHYGKSNYGYSIDDNEMEKFIELNDRNSEIADLLGGFKLHEFIKYKIRIPILAPTDYYLFSMSRSFRPRHIFDFGYNACLQINDRTKFLRRLRDAVGKKLGKEFEVQEINVTYVDPLRPNNGQKYVALSMKHFKFSYQTEFRVCLVPRNPVSDLGDPIFLELGSLEDISELIVFDPPVESEKDKLFDR